MVLCLNTQTTEESNKKFYMIGVVINDRNIDLNYSMSKSFQKMIVKNNVIIFENNIIKN